jgi:hypothetical protein
MPEPTTLASYILPTEFELHALAERTRDGATHYAVACGRRFYLHAPVAEYLVGLSDTGTTTAPRIPEEFIRQVLLPAGLVRRVEDESSRAPAISERAARRGYILRAPGLVPAGIVTRIASPLAPLFDRRIASVLVVAALGAHMLFVVRAGIARPSPWARDTHHIGAGVGLAFCAYALVWVVRAIHELGHAAAAHRFGARLGGVGYGLYAGMLVLFTDLSDAWRLPRRHRVVVNLGGVYFQFLASSLFAVWALVTTSPVARLVVVMNLVGLLYTANPVLRTDSYWVLVDMLGIVDLRAASVRWLRRVARTRDLRAAWSLARAQPALAAYAVLCVAFSALVVGLAALLSYRATALVPLRFDELRASVAALSTGSAAASALASAVAGWSAIRLAFDLLLASAVVLVPVALWRAVRAAAGEPRRLHDLLPSGLAVTTREGVR